MTAVEWVESDDWNAVKYGDRVKFDKGDESHTTRANNSTQHWILATHGNTYYKHDGLILSVVAAPAVLLPTEDGIYVDNGGSPWVLNSLGWWYNDGLIEPGAVVPFLPLIHMEPVPETAKKVLDAFRKCLTIDDSYLDPRLVKIAAEFGVTL